MLHLAMFIESPTLGQSAACLTNPENPTTESAHEVESSTMEDGV